MSIVRQLVFKPETTEERRAEIGNALSDMGKYLKRGQLLDGRHYILARFEDELDMWAFAIGSGFIEVER